MRVLLLFLAPQLAFLVLLAVLRWVSRKDETVRNYSNLIVSVFVTAVLVFAYGFLGTPAQTQFVALIGITLNYVIYRKISDDLARREDD